MKAEQFIRIRSQAIAVMLEIEATSSNGLLLDRSRMVLIHSQLDDLKADVKRLKLELLAENA